MTESKISLPIPKIETHLLHDPVAEFVAEQDPEGDMVAELPGGLNRIVMPSPRGGFYTTKVETDLAAQAERNILMRRGSSENALPPTPKTPKTPGPLTQIPFLPSHSPPVVQIQKDPFESVLDMLVDTKGQKCGTLFERHVIKDKIDGLSPRFNESGTPRRFRAYDALQSPRYPQ